MKEYGQNPLPIVICQLTRRNQHVLDDTTTRKMVKLLLPRQRVPENCAIRILGSLGRHLSFSIQVHNAPIVGKRAA